MKNLILFIWACFFLSNLYGQNSQASKRQFRGTWICTVRNLDWPSKQGLSVQKQKKELIDQLDLLQELGMNAIVLQVRPSGDAIYNSKFEPWSKFLTGEQGKNPGYDPLQFAIEETHKRGMEFHAWFNPYRLAKKDYQITLASNHIYHKHPDWVVNYAGNLYFDPGIPKARKFVVKIIADVVKRYDIDGVHFDDYFYPYKIEDVVFPDTLSFKKYHRGFTIENKDDWRRDNVNLLVKDLNRIIQRKKPFVHFGISPFGVWRNKSVDPKGSNTFVSQTNYDDLYADVLKWIDERWIDYITPQCYQYIGRPIMDYRIVAKWWDKNTKGVNYYIGQGPFRLGTTERGEAWSKGNEIKRQFILNDSLKNYQGSTFFRSRTFMKNPHSINELLRDTIYKYHALPPMSYKDKNKTNSISIKDPSIIKSADGYKLGWNCNKDKKILFYILYACEEEKPDFNNVTQIYKLCHDKEVLIKTEELKKRFSDKVTFYVSTLNRYRAEGKPIEVGEIQLRY